MNKEVKQFMDDKGYSGYVDCIGVRKDYKRGQNWDFKTLEYVLNEYRVWKNKKCTQHFIQRHKSHRRKYETK